MPKIAEQVGVRPRFSRKLSRSKRTRTESTVTAVLRWLRSNAVGQLKVVSFEKEIGFRKSRTSRGSSQVFGEAENGHADQDRIDCNCNAEMAALKCGGHSSR